jgi:argininosuccinate lyase
MPQKKNALVLEYIRSRTARVIGQLAGSFAVLHNVGYMDTEEVELETYQPLIEAFELTEQAVPTIDAFVRAMEPQREPMRQRAAWGFSSVTALAEAIQTQKNLSYRTAHRVVARSVLLAVEHGRDATGIDQALLDQAAQEMIGTKLGLDPKTIAECLDPRRFVDQHNVTGATAPTEVRRMASARRQRLTDDENKVQTHKRRIADGQNALRDAVSRIAG